MRIIASSIGKVLTIDDDVLGCEKLARAKSLLNVTKLVGRVQHICNKDNGTLMIEIKYETLPIFCYICGHIGHIERD